MIRRITCLSILAVLVGMLASMALAKFPKDFTTSQYTAAMHYGSLIPAEIEGPGIGMGDFRYHGTASAQLELVGNMLLVRGTYSRLAGPIVPDVATGIHIHHDPGLYHLDTIVSGVANEGEAAGAFLDAVYLTPEQQQMLVEGRLYMDVHTTVFPEGEVRGLIIAAEDMQKVEQLAAR